MTTDISEKAILHAILREDFSAFVHKVFNTADQQAAYNHNWHIDAIVWELMRCSNDENDRLIVTVPPRSLKSICISVAYVAWMIGHDPSLQFICVSYSDKLAADLSRQFKLVMESTWYRELFPGVIATKFNETEFRTTKGGSRLATSIGGTLTGRGADIIIIDDPLKAEDGLSETARNRVIDWYATTLVSRLNDKTTGKIILVMQRLHEEDLAGYLLEKGGWDHLNLPAIAQKDEVIQIGEDQYHFRQESDILHPSREPLEVLGQIKSDIGSLLFSAQYLQSPVPTEGNLIKKDWFNQYEEEPSFQTGDRIIQSWDLASTTNDTSDYSVCTTWLVRKDKYYLIDVMRDKFEYPELKRKIVFLANKFNAKTILLEQIGVGQHLMQQFKSEPEPGMPRPIGIKPDNDKLTRMSAQTSRIEAGQVYLPFEAPWLSTFMHELLAFPAGRNDDQVDSVSQFLFWIGKRPTTAVPGLGIDGFGPKVIEGTSSWL